jgi:selenide,water dikinase
MIRLTELSRGAGCACKMGAATLAEVLGRLPAPSHPDLLVGTDTGDDAMVWRRTDGPALVATTDFFTPIVDDAMTWGRVAATNAASDVYAMGGIPRFALNLVAWPSELDLDLLVQVLQGGAEAASRGGWIVGGGHTIDVAEPLYGQAVIGDIDPDRILTNAGAHAGDVLILTQPIGTGLVATAVKRCEPSDVAPGGRLASVYDAAVASMVTLNDVASRAALRVDATACTDVSGFGLLGHLHKMMVASGVRGVVDPAEVPTFDGAWDLIDEGFVPGGTERNLAFVRDFLDDGGHDAAFVTMLADPQTSGGLLFSCAPERAESALSELGDAGLRAEHIGDVISVGEGRAGELLLR